MIKITVVAPYKEFAELFSQTFKEHNENIHKPEYEQDEYELETIIAIGDHELKDVEFDSDVIVARGVTAYFLRNREDFIPVVEVPVAGNDLTRCLYEGKMRFNCKKAAVIGSYNMIHGVECLADIVGLEIIPLIMSRHEYIEDLVDLAVNKGCSTIIGGVGTCECAKRLGLNTILIKSGRESMWQAITEAKRAAYISRREQEKAQGFKTILDFAYEGVIAVDKKNIITVFNYAAKKILNFSGFDLMGKRADDIIPESKLRSIISTGEERLDEIIKYNDIQLAVNKVPIILKGENLGTVVTLQDVTRIQELEGKIREKMHARGFVAKHSFDDIIGESRKIKETIQMAKRFSEVDSNILIIGETGTGKELFAQGIHNYSPRSKGPFVAVNCAALPENLLESELFGYAEGAFTGAVKGGKIGLFELAHKGTIFLDEISEISPKLQGRLLRVIQEKEIMRIGHDRVIPVDVRIICATNKDLFELSQKGEFREDLYYRLDILKLILPSLRERVVDVPLLAEHFIKMYTERFRKGYITLNEKARKVLCNHMWPGNIRELRNICERLVVLSQSNTIDEEDIETILPKRNNIMLYDDEVNFEIDKKYIYTDEIKRIEKERIKNLLDEVGNNKIKAAEMLGISRTTLWRRMKELNIT